MTHEGLTIHPAAPVHKILGTAMGGLMWFWVMYRFYHDGETLIYGHEPHFLHDDHHDDVTSIVVIAINPARNTSTIQQQQQ